MIHTLWYRIAAKNRYTQNRDNKGKKFGFYFQVIDYLRAYIDGQKISSKDKERILENLGLSARDLIEKFRNGEDPLAMRITNYYKISIKKGFDLYF